MGEGKGLPVVASGGTSALRKIAKLPSTDQPFYKVVFIAEDN